MITRYPELGSTDASALKVDFSDNTHIDSFDRLRVSLATTVFDSQQEYGLDLLRTWDATANGTLPTILSPAGSVTNGSNAVGPTSTSTRMTPITVSTTNGHYAVLQSKQYTRYVPGKSHLVLITGVFAPASGFSPSIVRRTSTSGSVSDSASVPQASWNVDKLDGTGVSGITIDFTKTQIMFIAAQWLGVGRVIVGFDINGRLYPAHQFLNANSLTVPYTQTFNLPVRLEARNTSATTTVTRTGYFDGDNGIFLELSKTGGSPPGGTMYFVCASVQSEGGENIAGFPQSASNGITTIGVTTRRPILSIRPRTTFNTLVNRGHIDLAEFDITAATNNAFVEVVVGGTLTGASWLPVGTAVTAGGFVTGSRYVIYSVGTTDFTLIGAASNTVGVSFAATGAGTGTGTAVLEEAISEFDVSANAIAGGTVIKKGFAITGAGVVRGIYAGTADIRNPLVLSKIDALSSTQTPISLVITSFSETSNVAGTFNWHEQTI